MSSSSKQLEHKGGNTRRGRVLSLLYGAWHAYKPLICLSFCYLSGRCEFVGNLIRNFTLYLRVIIYLKKLRTSEWLKTSPFFMQCKCKVVTRMQFCCLWKIYLCLLTPNCTQNHVVTYIKNYTRKIYALLIGWNQVHLSCNTSAKLKHEYKLHITCTLSKFRLPCLWEMPFSCILLLGNNMISRAISCKEALEKFSKTTNCTRNLLRAREIFDLW